MSSTNEADIMCTGGVEVCDDTLNYTCPAHYEARLGRLTIDAEEVTYVRPIVMFEAICTCGWRQLHTSTTNANHDATEHHENGRHR